MPAPILSAPKLIHLDTIGTVIGAADFQARMELARSSARPLFKVRKNAGAQWTAAFVDGIGLAIASSPPYGGDLGKRWFASEDCQKMPECDGLVIGWRRHRRREQPRLD